MILVSLYSALEINYNFNERNLFGSYNEEKITTSKEGY